MERTVDWQSSPMHAAVAAGAACELQIESFLPGLMRPGRLGFGYASQREIPNTRNAPRADDQDEAVDGEPAAGGGLGPAIAAPAPERRQ